MGCQCQKRVRISEETTVLSTPHSPHPPGPLPDVASSSSPRRLASSLKKSADQNGPNFSGLCFLGWDPRPMSTAE